MFHHFSVVTPPWRLGHVPPSRLRRRAGVRGHTGVVYCTSVPLTRRQGTVPTTGLRAQVGRTAGAPELMRAVDRMIAPVELQQLATTIGTGQLVS